MKSMTGYGLAEEEDLSVEIRAYNSRFLDVQINLPSCLSSLETPLRELVISRCKRGSVDVSIRCRELDAPVSVVVHKEAARAYYDAACEIAKTLMLKDTPDLKTILSMEGVLEMEKGRGADQILDRIKPLLQRALDHFEAEKIREGEHTRADILGLLGEIEASLRIVSSHREGMDKKLKETVKTKFEELLGGGIDENRILAETAALLIKYTISEELSRLDAHVREFRAELERSEGSGKKLDFLCQEINREINTIGSKAQMVEVSMEVVNMKNALENIREQLRNVE